MTLLESINAEIVTLHEQHDAVMGTECEVYSRLVGFYGNVTRHVPGRVREIEERKVYDIEKSLVRRIG